MWSFYFHPLRMCNHLKDADAGFQVASGKFVCLLGVCIASSSYYMQVPRIFQKKKKKKGPPSPSPSVVSCSGACVGKGKKNKLLQQF